MVIDNQKILEIRKYFQSMCDADFLILLDKHEFEKFSIEELNTIFFSVSDERKRLMLSDFSLFENIFCIPPNRLKKSVLDLVTDSVRNFIFESPYLMDSCIAQEKVIEYFEKLSHQQIFSYIDHDSLKEVFATEDILSLVQKKFLLNSYLEDMVRISILENKFSVIALFSLKNEWELLIYTKFRLLVEVSEVLEEDVVILGKKIAKEYIQKVSRKHLNLLFEIALEKDNKVSHDELFVGVAKMYMILGFDNSKKVLNDFFTYATFSSMQRASVAFCKSKRRGYRLENQDKFYYYGIEFDLFAALRKKDIFFFENFCGRDLKDKVVPFMESLAEVEKNFMGKEKLEKAKDFILKVIHEREEYYENKDFSRYFEHYDRIKRGESIQVKDIFFLFSDVDLPYCLGEKGKIVPDLNVLKFLLGNLKRDNDCLLRMVLNQEALGLEEIFPMILNHYFEIEDEIIKDSSLSIYSILDIIDISKLFLYHLKPDETDISLRTFSKILNSRKHCTESPKEILRRTFDLHKERKKRISGAIPNISGRKGDFYYQMAYYDDEYLLISGIDTGSCFKVGGKGEEFFRFCLTNPCGMVFYIDYMEQRYVLPATVNGNMLNINSIDPVIEDENLFLEILKVLQEMGDKIIKDSRCDIDFVTLGDIHHTKFMKNTNYFSLAFSQFIPIGQSCYSDYMKEEVHHYVIVAHGKEVVPKYYWNKTRILQERKRPYIFKPKVEVDQERLHMVINQIYYTSLLLEEKDFAKFDLIENYVPLEVNNYLYIIGNKDWFVGIDTNYHLTSACLPYDERAMDEYHKAYSYALEWQKKYCFKGKELKKN
mgnify:CR=1 FL=1